MRRIGSRVLSMLLALVMVLSLALPASAASFTIPTSPISTDDGVIKATAARAGQVAPLILGADLVGSSNLGASSNDYNKINSILGVFGSDVNENPDPYLYNFNYNFYAADNGLSLVQNATISESQADGTPATTEAALNILTHRPDLILNQGEGTGNGTENSVYAAVIETLPENTDTDDTNDYSPSYYTCSISTLVYQCENLINLANVMNDITDETGLTTRYNDPYEIATDYDKYVWGYYFYIQKQLDSGAIAKKDVAVVSSTSDSGATWSLPAQGTSVSQSKPNRLVEYVRDNANLLNTTSETSATLSEILKCDVVIANGNGDTLRSAAAAAGYKEEDLPLIISTLPTCLYGMTMQTHENALGIPYLQSIIYGNDLSMNPVYAAAYFYQNFFHITDNAALQETVSTLLGSATLPEGATTALTHYDPKEVETIITAGIDYATDNGLSRHNDTEAWAPDVTVGIGSNTSKGPHSFTDLTESWYQNAVQYAYENNLFAGTSSTTFEPDTTMTRAMVVTVLYKLNGSPTVTGESGFADLEEDWYKKAVLWAEQNGITTGTGPNSFSPYDPATREQFVVLIAKYAKTIDGKQISGSYDLSGFVDKNSVSSWAVEEIGWAVTEGVIAGIPSGSDMLLSPQGSATRAQAAAILMNYLT